MRTTGQLCPEALGRSLEAITKDGKAPLPDHVISGLCATLHKVATGVTPGHAASEKR